MEILTIILAVIGIVSCTGSIVVLIAWISSWKLFDNRPDDITISWLHGILLVIIFLILFFQNTNL